jgi:transposase InsO family protein
MGTRKLHELLQGFYQEHSIKMGRDALFCTLNDHRLLIRRRRRRVSTTQSHHRLKKYSNLVKGWYPTLPEQLWVSDITYVPCERGYLYLSLVTDAYSHKIMGYHIADTLEAVHCIKALSMALAGRLHPTHNLIHHSDRGIQYCSSSYTELLMQNNISISMTESGDPLDNAIAERINGIIKHEYLKHYRPSNLEQATELLKQVVESYNERRPHLSLQMNTPNKVHHQKLQVNRQWKKSKRKSTIANQLNHL